jgi:hypothetical protein
MLKGPIVAPILLCVLCFAFVAARRGIRDSCVSPLVVFPVLYLLSIGLPSLFFALGIGGWDPLLKSAYISPVNQYVTWLLATSYLGYIAADYAIRARRSVKFNTLSDENPVISANSLKCPCKLPPYVGQTACNLVVVTSVVALVVGVLTSGWDELWEGYVVRGTGQWEAHHFQDYILLVVEACLVNSTITAGVLRAWFRAKRLWVAPLAWCLMVAPGGSRGTFIPFAIFLTASIVAGRKTSGIKMVGIALITLLSVMYIGLVRPRYVGIVEFAGSLGTGQKALSNVSDPLDAVSSLPTTTATFWVARDIEQRNVLSQLWRVLTPAPSFLVEQDIAATNLVAYVGHVGGNQGNPFPLVGELYLFFGWWGVLLGFLGGFTVAVLFEKSRTARPSAYPSALLWPALYTACVFAGVMGLHSGLRTTSRLPIWATVWYFCFITVVGLLREPLLQHLNSLPARSDERRAIRKSALRHSFS